VHYIVLQVVEKRYNETTTIIPMTDKKSKGLFLILLIALILSVGFTYYKAFVSENFEIVEE
jgi:hypothetical protein